MEAVALAASAAAATAKKKAAAAVATAEEKKAAKKEADAAAAASAKDWAAAAATAKKKKAAKEEADAAAAAAAKDWAEAAATEKKKKAAKKEADAAAAAMALNSEQADAIALAADLDFKDLSDLVARAEALAADERAAVQASKKRKYDLIHGQHDPARSYNVGNHDHISRLPDHLLAKIISKLPTKDGIRTQALSRGWRPLWRDAPISVVTDGRLMTKGLMEVDVVRKVLSEHRGPGLRFSLGNFDMKYSDMIGGWLSSKALDKLEELELMLVSSNLKGTYQLPSSAFRFAPTLRVAKFSNCSVTIDILPLGIEFPKLTQLTLHSVTISEDAFQRMLAGCTVIESLELKDNLGIGRLCISSQTLKSLGFCTKNMSEGIILQELVIEDAPCLEKLLRLDPKNCPATIRLISTPKLKILGMITECIAELQFGTTIFQKMVAVSLTTKLHSVRVLVLDSPGPNLNAVVNFLKCFPCLARLYVVFTMWIVMNKTRRYEYDPLDPIECLEFHLKEVVFKNYDGGRVSSVDFAKFFVLNAKVLKEMQITLPYHREKKWFAKQRERLEISDRASRDALIELKCGSMDDFTHDKDTHDLSIADPFDTPSSRCKITKCSNFSV